MDSANAPKITFRAGRCDTDLSTKPSKVKPVATPGWLYLYCDDGLIHFCWRARNTPADDPEFRLFMVPGDGSFQAYLGPDKVSSESGPKSPVKGRIFVLKFSSSSERHFFWLQSREQPKGDPSQFSPRDLKLGEIVNRLLQGEELNSGGPEDDGDTAMEDADGTAFNQDGDQGGDGPGGAGTDATGGDIREEGEGSREGGADGGRAQIPGNIDASAAVQNFLNSFKEGAGQSSQSESPFTTLPDLLTTSITLRMLDRADEKMIDDLLINHVPQTMLLLEDDDSMDEQMDPETVTAIVESLTLEQKRDIVRGVLRSPQFYQSLAGLTSALRDGGLPSISDALGVEVENGGYLRSGGGMPIGGAQAIKTFVEAVKKSVEKTNPVQKPDA